MKKLLLGLAAGGVALFATHAQAADTIVTGGYYAQPAPSVENVRTTCDAYGRCWRERTVVQRDYVEPAPPVAVERRTTYRRPAYYEQPTVRYEQRPAVTYRERPATYYESSVIVDDDDDVVYERPPADLGVSVGVGVGNW